MPGLARALSTLVGAVVVALVPGVAGAAPSMPVGSGLGHDISYPQCDEDLPIGQDFGIVGVNGGLATTANPCLAEQLSWAAASTGNIEGQPPLQVYVNTANPGQVRDQISTWPSRGDSPYGTCAGDVDAACSWVYGWNRASWDVRGVLRPAARSAGVSVVPTELVWWLDVETANTWQTGSAAARANNRASLEGMADQLSSTGAAVGIYSTRRMWTQIVGYVPPGSGLRGLDTWLAGGSSREEAVELCARLPLVAGGRLTLAQYVIEADGRSLDHNLPC